MDSSNIISYFKKQAYSCPVCDSEFQKEAMLSKSNRLIVTGNTDELRRVYTINPKYGYVNPLFYTVYVCPICLYAALSYKDFYYIANNKKLISLLRDNTNSRKNYINELFGDISFEKRRDIFTGTASYILAILSYSCYDELDYVKVRNAICSLRASWLLSDIVFQVKDTKYMLLYHMFFNKAAFYYFESTNYYNQKVGIDSDYFFGPDFDKDYGIDGLFYLATNLMLKQIDKYMISYDDQLERLKFLKSNLGRLIGSAKSSYDKPTIFIENVRTVYKQMNKLIKA